MSQRTPVRMSPRRIAWGFGDVLVRSTSRMSPGSLSKVASADTVFPVSLLVPAAVNVAASIARSSSRDRSGRYRLDCRERSQSREDLLEWRDLGRDGRTGDALSG